ncbi:MAG: ubiquinol-cytochrome c reductase iron-sulfur subunit [Candidatus Saccharimonadales bacterium]
MADKKKMSVAEILAAARKSDNASGGGESAAPAPAEPAAAEAGGETSAEHTAPAAASAAPAQKESAAKPQPSPKPQPAAGGRPSVADILKAAREKGGGAAAPAKAAASPKPAAAKPAAAKPAAKIADKPAAKPTAGAAATVKDTSSILAAARSQHRPGPVSKAEAAARLKQEPADKVKPVKPVVPPIPAKPDYARPKPGKETLVENDRRGFLSFAVGSFLGMGFTSLATTLGLWTLGTARFMFPNVLIEPPSRFKVGFPSDFAPGMVEEKFKAQFGVWVVKAEYQGLMQIYALRTVCTHLGCTPNWLEGEQKFKCPCHGSGFYKDGINFEGPAPRPLERYAIHLADDGQLEIDKSKMFQEEMGNWKDAASFVPV